MKSVFFFWVCFCFFFFFFFCFFISDLFDIHSHLLIWLFFLSLIWSSFPHQPKPSGLCETSALPVTTVSFKTHQRYSHQNAVSPAPIHLHRLLGKKPRPLRLCSLVQQMSPLPEWLPQVMMSVSQSFTLAQPLYLYHYCLTGPVLWGRGCLTSRRHSFSYITPLQGILGCSKKNAFSYHELPNYANISTAFPYR